MDENQQAKETKTKCTCTTDENSDNSDPQSFKSSGDTDSPVEATTYPQRHPRSLCTTGRCLNQQSRATTDGRRRPSPSHRRINNAESVPGPAPSSPSNVKSSDHSCKYRDKDDPDRIRHRRCINYIQPANAGSTSRPCQHRQSNRLTKVLQTKTSSSHAKNAQGLNMLTPSETKACKRPTCPRTLPRSTSPTRPPRTSLTPPRGSYTRDLSKPVKASPGSLNCVPGCVSGSSRGYPCGYHGEKSPHLDTDGPSPDPISAFSSSQRHDPTSGPVPHITSQEEASRLATGGPSAGSAYGPTSASPSQHRDPRVSRMTSQQEKTPRLRTGGPSSGTGPTSALPSQYRDPRTGLPLPCHDSICSINAPINKPPCGSSICGALSSRVPRMTSQEKTPRLDMRAPSPGSGTGPTSAKRVLESSRVARMASQERTLRLDTRGPSASLGPTSTSPSQRHDPTRVLESSRASRITYQEKSSRLGTGDPNRGSGPTSASPSQRQVTTRGLESSRASRTPSQQKTARLDTGDPSPGSGPTSASPSQRHGRTRGLESSQVSRTTSQEETTRLDTGGPSPGSIPGPTSASPCDLSICGSPSSRASRMTSQEKTTRLDTGVASPPSRTGPTSASSSQHRDPTTGLPLPCHDSICSINASKNKSPCSLSSARVSRMTSPIKEIRARTSSSADREGKHDRMRPPRSSSSERPSAAITFRPASRKVSPIPSRAGHPPTPCPGLFPFEKTCSGDSMDKVSSSAWHTPKMSASQMTPAHSKAPSLASIKEPFEPPLAATSSPISSCNSSCKAEHGSNQFDSVGEDTKSTAIETGNGTHYSSPNESLSSSKKSIYSATEHDSHQINYEEQPTTLQEAVPLGTAMTRSLQPTKHQGPLAPMALSAEPDRSTPSCPGRPIKECKQQQSCAGRSADQLDSCAGKPGSTDKSCPGMYPTDAAGPKKVMALMNRADGSASTYCMSKGTQNGRNTLLDLAGHPYTWKLFKSILLFLLGMKICSESWFMMIPIRGMGGMIAKCPCPCD